MVFYKGAVNYKDFQEMPIPEIVNLKNNAERINREINREQKKASR
jgi:hypothetical protein